MAQYRIDSHGYLPQEKTLFEVVMLADQYGNQVGPANPTGVAVDAFGRARVSMPFTLFDSSHRFKDNGLWVTSNSVNTSVTFSPNEGVINLVVGTSTSNSVIRETTRVFSYQPGKSLQIFNTFAMANAQTNLVQKVGYYGANNGIYLEQSNNDIFFVQRSYTSGTLVETKVAQADWNADTLLGAVNTSPSQRTLDLSKAQIMFTDIEWLGVGTVRCGFVIDGQIIHCHSFHHANEIITTYMTTASLPLRYEIANIGPTGNTSLMKQICSSVISEGGYELRGSQKSIALAVNAPRDLTSANTDYPVMSIRLKSDRLDAIVIPTAASLFGIGNNGRFLYKLIDNGTLVSPSWVSGGNDSAVEYDISATSISGGNIVASGYFSSTTQSDTPVEILKAALFRFQLQRNSFTSNAYAFSVVVSALTAGDDVLASLDWEEISR